MSYGSGFFDEASGRAERLHLAFDHYDICRKPTENIRRLQNIADKWKWNDETIDNNHSSNDDEYM